MVPAAPFVVCRRVCPKRNAADAGEKNTRIGNGLFGLPFKKVWRQRRTLFMSVQDRLHSVTVLLAIPLLVNLYGRWFIAQHLVAVWFLDAAFAAAAFHCVLAVRVHKSSTSAIGVVARRHLCSHSSQCSLASSPPVGHSFPQSATKRARLAFHLP